MIGVVLYAKSPVIKYFWTDTENALLIPEFSFYSIVHVVLMVTAIVLLTVGSALAKRKTTDKEKFRTVLVWFSMALLIVLVAIPWPFSPLANRPYLRMF